MEHAPSGGVLSAARAYLRMRGADLGSSLALYGAYARAALSYALDRDGFVTVGQFLGRDAIVRGEGGILYYARARTDDLGYVAANTKPHTRRWFRPRRGDVVVDVGAHIGRFSLAAARAGASVVAVEPNPETFRVLAANVGLNGFRNVRLVNAALGEREGEAELHVPLVYHGTASLRGDWERRFATRTVRVRVTTLDGLVEYLGLERIDWLLVDVEGYELEVLRGGLGALGRVQRAIVEVSLGNLGAVPALLERAGLRLAERGSPEGAIQYHFFVRPRRVLHS